MVSEVILRPSSHQVKGLTLKKNLNYIFLKSFLLFAKKAIHSESKFSKFENYVHNKRRPVLTSQSETNVHSNLHVPYMKNLTIFVTIIASMRIYIGIQS